MRSAILRLGILLTVLGGSLHAQERKSTVFTRADTLRGTLSPLRSCFDVRYYHLDVRIDPAKEFIEGSNAILFSVVKDFDRMQIDLSSVLGVQKILLDGGNPLPFTREFNAVFIQLPAILAKGSSHELTVFYSGTPVSARRPPWEGGISWTRDSTGNPWVVVTCQGAAGANIWWPTKDHQSDKPDSMLISITVPKGLMDVSNGRLRAVTELSDGWTRYDWFVSRPINNYNATFNIGKYAHFSDTYVNGDTLTLDYYVLPSHLQRARVQFRQVKGMMAAYEKYFGKYPFIRDGYKLIESPHTGMEHQSAVAYGNWYIQGYRGRASSEVGLKFDFIIIHESAHEWWGNSVTSNDLADMWIHESFGAYAEALYVEFLFGRKESLTYINGKKPGVFNAEPIIGPYNVNRQGSGDMYNKGQLMLNTLRSVIDNDSLWFSILRSIQENFRYQSINAEDIFNLVNTRTGKDFTPFFEQYLKQTKIPVLEAILTKKGERVTLRYRWNAGVSGFSMPVKVSTAEGRYEFITPTSSWQTMKLGSMLAGRFKVADDLFYVDLKLNWMYLDPELPGE